MAPPDSDALASPSLTKSSRDQVRSSLAQLGVGSKGGAAGDSFSVRRGLAWGVRWQLQAGCISPGSLKGRGSKGILWGPRSSWQWLLGSRALHNGKDPAQQGSRGAKGEGNQPSVQDPDNLKLDARKGPHITEAPKLACRRQDRPQEIWGLCRVTLLLR